MSFRARLALLGVLGLLSAGVAPRLEAQFEKKLKKAVKKTAEDKVIKRVTMTEGEVLDTVLGTGKPARADTLQPDTASKAAAAFSPTDVAPGGAPSAGTGPGARVNYDFKPGDRVLLAEDFAGDQVGDFPRGLELKEGNMEVAQWQGGRYLQSSGSGSVYVPLPEVLPERFTLELDYAGPSDSPLEIYFSPMDSSPTYVTILPDHPSGVQGGGVTSKSAPSRPWGQNLFPVRVMVDGRYAKVYVDDKRVANAPNTNLGRSNRITIKLAGTEETPAFVGNIRVATPQD